MKRNRNDSSNRRWLRVALPAAALLAAVVAAFHAGPNSNSSRVAILAQPAVQHSPQVLHSSSSGSRPVYPLSVIEGGAYTAAELRNKLNSDAVAARHYQNFRLEQVSSIETKSASLVYVSYRKGSSIYWTQKPIRLAKGEKLLTDGVLYARARCGNRISTTPKGPVALLEPPDYIFDRPETWQPETGPLPPPPNEPAESRSSAPVGALPSIPAQEMVAGKHTPFFPLFPVPVPIGTGGGSGSRSTGGGGVTYDRAAPEIDLGSGANAVALILGSLLVLRSRRKA
jgi:hypothetical protein